MVRVALFAVLSLPLLLGGCGSFPHGFSDDAPQVVAQPDQVSAMLADAASKASNALQTLASVEQARTPRVTVSPIGDAPTELRRAVTLNWVGPVELITQTLASKAGYNFKTVGDKPGTPVVVTINAVNQPVIEVLRDIGLQLGKRGDIRVDGGDRTVEIQYPPNSAYNVGVGDPS
ncbi:MAG: DotD/TraH family lipoprotein [Alphaproteobacteria bacterium]|nr:DotD/TraH family lipoprotein [Alphaproteobacteria bacterium]